jgi:small subunit ribosomal protein S1
MKQCVENPWGAFAQKHEKGQRVKGKIKSITDFGLFIGLDGGIDGLVHLSDISWEEPGERAIRNYKKGDEIEAIILAIDSERERISLGLKQLIDDPFTNYAEANPKGALVKGKVVKVEEKQALIELAPDVMGRIKAAEVAAEKVDDIHQYLKEGEEIEARIISVNHKDRMISLSIKVKSKEDFKKYQSSENAIIAPTLGDILKEQMAAKESDEEPPQE